jgi:PAS domain S-box-containing protein
VPVGQYKIGLIAAEGKPILTNEVIGDSRIPEQAWAKREGLVAFAGYPLLSQQEVLGVMALFARHPLPAVTLNSLATVAHRITVGLERQKATEENTRLVRFTQSLLASAGEGIYGLDLDGHTTFVNPAAATMLGYTPEELLGTPMHETVHHTKPDGTPYPRETCPKYAAFNDGMVHQVEDEVLWRKDGTSFPVSYMSTPRWEDGQLVGAVVTFQDISERKQAEATIRKSEQRFRAIYDQAPVGIAILDSVSGQFQDINKQYCDIVGYSQEEMLSRSFQSITHPKDLQLDLDNMQKLLSGETSSFKMEKRYIRKDGNIIWVALTCVPLWLEDADPRSHIAIVEDITKQKQAEEKIFQQQAKLRTLSVEVALAEEHERKRIAAVLHDDIGQNLALLKLKLGFLQDIHHSIKKSVITAEGLDLIEQTIASTRTLTYGLVSPLLYELGFAEGIQNLCEQIQDRHPEMHIQFQLNDQSLKLSDQMSIVLFRIIRELLFNIEKHAGATKAELKINVRDKQLHITLKDDGVGFDITNLGTEFSSEGGFGLFSIQEQVRGLGGIFEIRSTLGKGTQVFLTMPYS